MKLVYFIDEFPPFFRGGLGTYAMELTRKFIEMGHDVTVFSRNTGDDPTRDVWQGVEVHRPLIMDLIDILPVFIPEDVKTWPVESQRFFGETLLFNILSASKLIRQIVREDRRKFDIIASHDWLSAIGGIISKRNLNLPFVFHFHSTEQGRVKDGSPTVKDIERLAGMKSDLIVTVSYAMRDELVSLGYSERKIQVVYNGVDAEKYNPANFNDTEISSFRKEIGVNDSPVILFIGRLTWVKGVDTLIRAMPVILRDVPNVKLVILGMGEEEDLIRHLIRSLGIEKNVITHFKYVSEEERLLYYASCDVAVFPSKYEPFGIVCTEAMSMGKAVVVGARGTSGMREQVIPEGENICGFHINPHDPSDIAKYVSIILRDDELRNKMGKNARKRVLENFTWDKIAEDMLDVYRDVLEEGI
ncbi:MAG TPA: glycosyltransferase family 1 protein [Archaeoglobaceae archaeon]|nr:glycosyltransferase family 1 protein [Archaeoglobaceae archaeon]